MTANSRPDIFTSVHKGLRKALLDLTAQAGITLWEDDSERRDFHLRFEEVFHFVAHHAANEDRYLIPEMRAKAMREASLMGSDHENLEKQAETLHDLAQGLGERPDRGHVFYLELSRFTADYFQHLLQEEQVFAPVIYAGFSDAELAEFSRQSVANTAPKDQAMMLGYMFPAMNASELRGFFSGMKGKVPEEAYAYLKGLAEKSLGPRYSVIADIQA